MRIWSLMMIASDLAYFSRKDLSKSAIDLLLECPALYSAVPNGENKHFRIPDIFISKNFTKENAYVHF